MTTTNSKIKGYYVPITVPHIKKFWSQRSPVILYNIRYQLPPALLEPANNQPGWTLLKNWELLKQSSYAGSSNRA